ncbi:hypothetical protein ACFL2F_02440 [Myxococcota bacterium]
MGWVLLRYLPQACLVIVPLFTIGFSLTNFLGIECEPGEKEKTEFFIRAGMSSFFLALILIYEVVDLYMPRLNRRGVRNGYLEQQYTQLSSRFPEAIKDQIRFNVMCANRHWYHLFLFRSFRWIWNRGFDPPNHIDSGMKLKSWQGVCGRALKAEVPKFADMRRLPDPSTLSWASRHLRRNKYRLSKSQLKKTKHIRAVLSVPIYRLKSNGANPIWKTIGVINIDATSDTAAEFLRVNRVEFKTYLVGIGKVLTVMV